MELIRAFIAIDLPPDVREVLGAITRDLQSRIPQGVRWVRPEGIHLTLRFLGDINPESVESISQAMSRTAGASSAFGLSLGELGAFPSLSAPRVVWMGLEGSLDRLLALQRELEDGLEELGYARESRPFSPHLTLGRIRDGITGGLRRQIGEIVAGAPVAAGTGLPVKEVSLIRSILGPSGGSYTRLSSAALGLGS